MAAPSVLTSRPATRRALAAQYARLSVVLAALLLAVRIYEQLLAGSAHRLPLSAVGAWLRAFGADLAFAAWVALVCALPVFVIGHVAPRLARHCYHAVIVVVVVVAAALAQYFAVTGVPLGADLFGYSWHDIRETIGSSGGTSLAGAVGLLFFAALALVVPRLSARLRWSPRATIATAVALPVLTLLSPAPGAFDSDAEYQAALSKPSWFATRSVHLLLGTWRDARDAAALSGYPLTRAVRYDDVLGPHLALGATKPNLVFVIVEGLGRDFTGPGAAYGGFTPFLDSLTERSLSWDNFLSTSGRTFGVLPSLLGSLPFGKSGFMELGDAMPAHATLITLLRQAGYTSNYFTGTNGAFDRIDVFMDRQGVDRFIDAGGYGPAYEKMPASAGGQSWGYPDDALFRRSLELLDVRDAQPRVDTYLTISTHEPFIPPRQALYAQRFERRLNEIAATDRQRAAFRASQPVFESLLYADDALRQFLAAYAARADYARTIFFITGDHRLIPVPPSNRLARYHVPFVVFSPMLRAPRHIGAVSSHFDVLPSVLALLRRRYGIAVPDSAPWIGTGLDTARAFGAAHPLPLMRTKNELDEFFTGTGYLAGEQFYAVDASLQLTPVATPPDVPQALRRFRALNRYTTTRNRIAPATAMAVTSIPDHAAVAAEDSAVRALDLDGVPPEQAFNVARDLASRREFVGARLILRHLLRQAPSYHDARALLGRTYAWEHRYDEARPILDDLIRRAPSYPDGLAARIELDVYLGHGAAARAAADLALAQFPRHPTLLYDRARALELVGDKAGALRTLDELQRVMPSHTDAEALRRRLGGR